MISLDVTALFTNVPLDFVLNKLEEQSEMGNVNFPIPTKQFLDLIRLCVSSTVFSFNNEGYRQKYGVAMGSPLSPLLANLCMEFVENEILNNCDPSMKPLIWLRYVDDIFIIFNDTQSDFDSFFNYVNNILPSIKFTVEYEIENKLPFLDVLVYHDPISMGFKFTVYRKSTNSESYIHFYSFHNVDVKQNIISNFALRALKICDPEYIDRELKHIKETFIKLCYPENFISKAFSKARKTFYSLTQNRQDKKQSNFITLPFNPSLQNIRKIVNRNNEDKVNMTFNYKNTLKRRLMKNNNTNEENKQIGVYEIPCNDCEKKYYGESGRGLSIRITEHKRAYNLHAENNALVNHSFNQDHRIDWQRSRVLFNSKNIGIRRLVEGAIINNGRAMEGNKSFTQEDHFTNDVICKEFIKDFNRTHINNNRSTLATSDAAASLSFVQVTETFTRPSVTGAQAVQDILGNNLTTEPPLLPPRRSRRLAGLSSENEGIT